MVTSFSLLRRRGDLDPRAFASHWREVHAPLVRHVDYLRGYVQHHRLPASTSDLDGIAEFWWDTRADALRPTADPAYTEHARRDEPNFLDMDSLAALQATPRVLRAAAAPCATRTLVLLQRRRHLGAERFGERCTRAWQTAIARAGVACTVHLVEEAGEDGVDAIVTCQGVDVCAPPRWWTVLRDGADGSDPERSRVFAAVAHVVIEPQ